MSEKPYCTNAQTDHKETQPNAISERGVSLSAFRVLVPVVLALLSGCGPPINVPLLTATSDDLALVEAAGNYPHLNKYSIEPGDAIEINYPFHPEMNQKDIVQPDGKITVAQVGEVAVAGLTTVGLEELLKQVTSKHLRDPEVTVSITHFSEKAVYVTGEVRKPGKIVYRKGLTPLQAISEAGGFLETARVDSVVLVRTGGSEDTFISRKMNLEEVVTEGVQEPVDLAPADVVFVPRSPIANVNLWVRQHITEILSFGARAVPTPRP